MYYDGLPATPHDDPLGWLIGGRIDFLVCNEGWDKQEVTRLQIDFVL